MPDSVYAVSGVPDVNAANPVPPTLQDALAAGFAYRNASKSSADVAAGHATDAQAAATTATGAASAASADAEATAADRAAVSADRLEVEQQKDAVTVIRGEIATYTAVAQQAATDAANTAADADQVHVDRLAADASASAAAGSATSAAASAAALDTSVLLAKANNLSDLPNPGTARTNLGLGDAATKTTGTSVGNVVAVQTGGKLPALDGSNLTNVSSNRVLISVTDAVAAAAVDFTGLSSTYTYYEIEIEGLTSAASLWLRTSSDNGASFDAGASDYAFAYVATAGSISATAGTAAAQINLGQGVGATSGSGNMHIKLAGHATTGNKTVIGHCGTYDSGSPIVSVSTFYGARLSATAVNAFRLLPSSGTLSGKFMLFGVRS